ncbi:MAG TPA: DUF4019 domain-containing protein [Ramlibacter sp.]|uniref:DUF4019 domain-containing protein n=1 Tax=Ramlibacter sp. TaxID=1917967 RepID=UPI002B6DFE77|nr:DUF4019 domain-containing protein [Ramlibacter sp.]HVZ45887.1 DUF4019 domain-containing protein [Ramlibacter sp.]
MKRRVHLLSLLGLTAVTRAFAQLKPSGKAPPEAAPAAPAAAASGVKRDTEKENEGKLAATGWIGLLDRRDWGTAWERSSALFRKNVSLGMWMDNVPKVREPLGALVEREVAGVMYKTSLPGYPDGDYVTVLFESKFERKADAKEIVTTLRESDGRWRVTGYQVQ